MGLQGVEAGLPSTWSTLFLQLSLMPGERTEPRAAPAPLYMWQDLKKIEQSEGNRGICRKKSMFFAFISADPFKHLCPKVCVQVEKAGVGYLPCQTPGPLPRASKAARVSC